MSEEKKDKEIRYVPWPNFIWAISLLTLVMFSSIGVSMIARAEAAEVKNKYETDIVWIRQTLSEIKTEINK
jgi:hypothetical protein